MLEFQQFCFSSPPHTGEGLFLWAARNAGLTYHYSGTKYTAPPIDCDKFILGIVRHPVSWLCEYFLERNDSTTDFSGYSEQIDELLPQENTFDGFLQRCSQIPNLMYDIFAKHRTSSVIKFEELPCSAAEFFESIGVQRDRIQFPKVTQGSKTILKPDPSVRLALMRSEYKFCEEFDYY